MLKNQLCELIIRKRCPIHFNEIASYSIPNRLYLITYINYMPKPKEKENLCMSRHIPNETRQHAKVKAFNYKFEKES